MVGLIGAMAVELEQLKAQMENLREEKIGMDVLYTVRSLDRRLCWRCAVLARSTRRCARRA